MCASGTYMMVMTATGAGINSHENRAVAEQLRPAAQYEKIIDRELQPGFQRPGVFFACSEIRREQQLRTLDLRQCRQHALDLPWRDALEADAFRRERLQN